MSFDGKQKLSEALASLYGLSSKSHNKLAKLIDEAKAALGIATKAKNLHIDVKLAIYQWHCDKLHRQAGTETVEKFSQSSNGDIIEIISQAEYVDVEATTNIVENNS